MLRPFLLLLTISWTLAFRPIGLPTARRLSSVIVLASSSREEEIARLEEQLRKLKKEEQPLLSEVDIAKATAEATTLTEEEKSYIIPDKNTFDNVKAKDMLLSEGALIEAKLLSQDDGDDDAVSNGSPLSTVLAAVGAVFLLLLFSQIPLGQEDFSRYSVNAGPGAVTTSIDLGDLNPDRQSTSP